MTYTPAPAPARIRDLKPVLLALVAAADLLNAVDLGGTAWLSSLTKPQLWQVADIVTAPGLSDATQWELIAGIRDAKITPAKSAQCAA